MLIASIQLQQFRNHEQTTFSFAKDTTIIVGQNTSGKTNLLDSISLLSSGKSFVAEKDEELIQFGYDFARVKGSIVEEDNDESQQNVSLEVLITSETAVHRAGKRYFVNGVPRRRTDFTSHLPILLFTPLDLEIISDGPSYRRNFLDQVLEQTDQEYKIKLQAYTKGLRQRNALLEQVKESGIRNDYQFQYWDELLIKSGSYINTKRQEFLNFINKAKKDIIDCSVVYDQSVMSEERLQQYKEAESRTGVTLVGPHRDDVEIQLTLPNKDKKIAKVFGSRGQQRLIILQLKLLQLQYMKDLLQLNPLLLLDDIFSELDKSHINLVSQMIHGQQTIITTTHGEFIMNDLLNDSKMIELKR